MRKFFEKIVEGGLLISGSVSSFTILLIVFFLFKEAGGLFNTPAIEEGYVLAVNKSNDVGKLSPEKIMDIFDGNITNWKDISGMDQDILIFRFSDLTNYYTEEELGDEFQYVPQKISELVAKEPGIIAFFPKQYLLENGFQGKVLPEEKITLGEFFGGTKWYPTSTPAPIFGLIPLLLGTLLVSIGAIALSLPFGVAVAIYMAEIANTKTRNLLKRRYRLKYLKSKLFTSLFATLLILSFCMAKPAQVHASNADSAKMARWMSICSSMADNIEKKHFVYSNGGTARTYNSAVKRSRRSNCALYVSWCLQKYGALGSGQTFYIRRGSSSIRKNFGHWKKYRLSELTNVLPA